MSFSVDMPVDQISVEAGSTAPANFTIHHSGSEADQFEVQIEGLDPEWTAAPSPMVLLEPNAQQTERVFFKPPRLSESQAGTYPFVIRVRSLTSGESKFVQGILSIRPFHYLSMELSPKRGIFSPTRKENVFEATIMNLGNTEHSLQVFGNDPEDELGFTFSNEQVVLGPGQTKIIEATVTPLSSKPFSTSRLHSLSIGARSIDTPSVACSSQAQLEHKAIMSPGSIALALFVIGLFIGWLMLLPKPPEMEFLRLSKNQAFEGDRIKISWKADNAERVRILMGQNNLVTTSESFGSFEFTATESGMIEAFATNGSKRSNSLMEQLEVSPKPIIPEPKIQGFSITPRTASKGDKLTVRYLVNGAVTKLTLSPPGQVLDPKIDTIFISADVVGTIPYKLVAENAEGKTVTQTISVTVVDPTLPRVDELLASPATVEGTSGTSMISWRTTNAVRIELSDGNESFETSESSGTREYTLEKSTEFTLTVFDNQGRKTSKKIRVEVKSGVPTVPPGDDGASTAGGQRPTNTPPTTGGGR